MDVLLVHARELKLACNMRDWPFAVYLAGMLELEIRQRLAAEGAAASEPIQTGSASSVPAETSSSIVSVTVSG